MKTKPTPHQVAEYQREFHRIHLEEKTWTTSCIHCYPLPTTTSKEFNQLWKWLRTKLNAILVIGYTLTSFNRLIQEARKRNRNREKIEKYA